MNDIAEGNGTVVCAMPRLSFVFFGVNISTLAEGSDEIINFGASEFGDA